MEVGRLSEKSGNKHTTGCITTGDCSFGTHSIYFYELFIITLSPLPLCWTQTRNWQSQNVASVLATLWGCSLIDTVLFTLQVAVNTDSRRCRTQWKISGQRPERCQVLCYKPRSTSFATRFQTQCCKLRYKYFVIRGWVKDTKGQMLWVLQETVRKCDLQFFVSQEVKRKPFQRFRTCLFPFMITRL